MIEIISKSDGPRREDAAARRFIRDNASTINKIANQLGGGGLGARSNRNRPARISWPGAIGWRPVATARSGPTQRSA